FRPDPVPREVIDRIVATATSWRPPRFSAPPWRVMVVVGDERERLIARLAEALGRHWGSTAAGLRGLAAESVLQAPALVLVFSMVPPAERAEAFGVVAGAVQSMMLLAASNGLGTHRIPSAHVVPEAALDYAAEFLGPQIRGGDLVTLLAVGWPAADRVTRPVSVGVEPLWVGDGEVPTDDIPS